MFLLESRVTDQATNCRVCGVMCLLCLAVETNFLTWGALYE